MAGIPVTPYPDRKNLTKFRTVRNEAKNQIKGKRFSLFIRTVFGYLILFLIGVFPLITGKALQLAPISGYILKETVALAVSLASLFAAVTLNAGLKAGRMASYWNLCFNQPVESMWFYCRPSQIFRCVKMWILLLVFKFCWGALLFSPGFLLMALCVFRFNSAGIFSVTLLLFVSAALALAAGALFYKFITERYSLAWYFFTELKNGSALGAVRFSARVIEGQCLRSLKFQFFRFPFYSYCQRRACFGKNALKAKGLKPKRAV